MNNPLLSAKRILLDSDILSATGGILSINGNALMSVLGGLLTGNLERAASVGADGLTLSTTGIARTGTTADLDLNLSAKGTGAITQYSKQINYGRNLNEGVTVGFNVLGGDQSVVNIYPGNGLITDTDATASSSGEQQAGFTTFGSYNSGGVILYNYANAPFYFAGNGPADPTTDFWGKLGPGGLEVLPAGDTAFTTAPTYNDEYWGLYIYNQTTHALGVAIAEVSTANQEFRINTYTSAAAGGGRTDLTFTTKLMFGGASYFDNAGADLHLTGNLYFGASSGLLRSGNHVATLTSTGTTNVTLPTTGTLATLAGAESLTNKKLGSLTTNGFVRTSGGDGTLSADADIGYNLSAYGAGTAYALTNAAAKIDFGTTDPVLVINKVGTYIIMAQVNLAYNGATVVAETATIKVRRTNNTAADVSQVVVLDLPASTILTETYGIFPLPPFIYTTTNIDDSLEIFGNVSAALGAGTIDATAIGTSLVAIRLY